MEASNIKRVISSIISSRVNPSEALHVSPDEVSSIAMIAGSVLEHEPAVLQLTGDYVIVGDIHGNINTLLRILEKYNYPPNTRFLFLGDYVDRGMNSIEVITLLFALKILFPDHIYLIRGNHECAALSQAYGFKTECYRRACTYEMYVSIVEQFEHLPICAIMNETTFCVHGGISKSINSIDDIYNIPKGGRDPFEGIVSDLLWSDPTEEVLDYQSSPRRCGMIFGYDALTEFLSKTGLKQVIRSHENCDLGFNFPFGKDVGLVTIFSSCDYCESLNDAGVLNLVTNRPLDESSIGIFQPIVGKKLKMRRILMPPWLIEETAPPLKSLDDSKFASSLNLDFLAQEIII